MELNVEQQRALADLHGNAGFQILVQLFREFEDSILQQVSQQHSNKRLAHLARYYQFARVCREAMESEVAGAFDELQRLIEQGLIDNETHLNLGPTGHNDAWHKRFGVGPGASDEPTEAP